MKLFFQLLAYRGMVLMAKDPEAVKVALLKDGMQTDPYGENLAFTAPFQEITPGGSK